MHASTSNADHPGRPRPGLPGRPVAAALTALLVAAGCVDRRTQPVAYPRPVATATAAPGAAGDTTPLAALERVDAWLTSRGAARLGPAQRNPNLPENRVIAYALDPAPGQCLAVVAFAAPENDLDLVLLGPGGEQIAHDVRDDPHPWLAFCPTAPGRHVVRVQMSRGAGEYYYAVYTAPRGALPDLAAYWGLAGEAGPAQAALDPATAQRLAALDQRLAQEGFSRSAAPQGLVLSRSQERLFPVELEAGVCYAFATLAGPGARDTDAALVDGTQREVVQDVSNEPDALVRLCPAQTQPYRLRVRMYDGQGPLFTAAWTQTRGAQAQPTGPVLGSGSVAGVGLEENFRLLDADMRARGYETFGAVERGSLAQGAQRQYEVELEGGKCYALLGVGDNGVRDLDLQLLGAGGALVDRDIETDARPVVRVCPERTGRFTMNVRMYSGSGSFVYATYRWPRGIRGPFGLEGLIYVRLAEVTSLLDVEGYQPDLDVEPGRGRFTAEGQSRTHALRLPRGQCVALLVVGGDGVNDLEISVTQGGRTLASEQTRTAFPSVRLCTEGDGAADLVVRAASGAGEYFYQVFRRG